MTNITLNRKNRTIIISKAFEKKANKYGSEEYYELNNAIKENKGFKVVVKATSKTSSPTDKMTIADIKRYIEYHEGEKSEAMKEFNAMRKGKKTGETAVNSRYFEIKEWFLVKYGFKKPAVKKVKKKENEEIEEKEVA